MNIRLVIAIAITAGSLASCVYPPPPPRRTRPQTGASLDRPASGERSARETRYLEQEASQAPVTPPADGTAAPTQDPSIVQAPTNATQSPAEAPPPGPTKVDAPKEAPPPPSAGPSELPYGKPVPGKKGFVYSPYDQSAGFVDVRDISPGTKVRCPYTGKIFRVP